MTRALLRFISGLSSGRRHLLWLLLLLMTPVLFLFPVNLEPQYEPVQSLFVFSNLPVFGTLYYVWLLPLLLLVFFPRNETGNEWERIALIWIFVIVFLGFWVFATPLGRGEDRTGIVHVTWINAYGRMPSSWIPELGYYDFPGLFFVGSAVSQITGLSPVFTRTALLLFSMLSFSILLYAMFRLLFNSGRFASVAVLTLIQGAWMITQANWFFPANFGLLLILCFLLLLARRTSHELRRVPETLITLVVFAAAVITHFVTSALFFFVSVGILVLRRVSGSREASPLRLTDLVLFVVLPAAWLSYWATHTLVGLATLVPQVFESVVTGNVLYSPRVVLTANVGQQIPLWANATRLFWLILIYGFGTLLGIGKLLTVRRIPSVEQTWVGGFIGIGALSVVAFSLSASFGGEQFNRFLWYAPFYTVPFLFWFLLRMPFGKAAFSAFVVFLFVLSFPTFLAHNPQVTTSAYQATGAASDTFISSHGGLRMEAAYPRAAGSDYTSLKDQAGVWRWLDSQTAEFRQSVGSMFVYSDGLRSLFRHLLGVEPEDPGWTRLTSNLSKTALIYDNGQIQIFSNQNGPTN